MTSALITIVVFAAVLKLLAWWLEPRMAFFPWTGVQQTPATAGLEFTELRIPTADGETLHGWWMPHPEPRAQVLYWHGNGGNLSLWLEVLVDLRRRGFSVMAVDYRGYGASTGRPSERGVYHDADAAHAYFAQHLKQPETPVVIWGRSLGCAVASYAAAKSPPDALILESPFPDVRALFAGNPVMLGLSVFSTYRFPTAAHLQHYRGRLLVIHGEADSIIPFSRGQRVFEGAGSADKVFVALQGADHNDAHADHSAYWPAIDRFLRAH
ncbi:MAG: alpha/beta hydrolase [Vicinamibacterales bacterium]